MRAAPNVFSIPPGLDFAREVVNSLLAGRLFPLPDRDDPLWLADLVLYVPTRRAGKLFERAFVAAAGERPAILPEIRPLAEAGDDTLTDPADQPDPDTRRILTPEERAFRLQPAIRAWQEALIARRAGHAGSGFKSSMAENLALGDALGRLIDEMAIESAPLSLLASVTPENFDASRFDDYWALTRDFLKLAAEHWPQQLKTLEAEDRIEARLRMIRDETRRLAEKGVSHPVVIAGSTGSVRATAELMRVVARLPQGAVVLPGLDQALDADDPDGAWALIGDEKASLPTRFAHPQASLKRSLEIIGIDRADVTALGAPDAALVARNRLVSESLRPAETSIRWPETRRDFPVHAALEGMMLIETADEQEEARTIAVLMRQTLESPVARTALVTADRGLARRVSHELARLGIEAADSAGASLAETSEGMRLRLLLEAADQNGSAAMLAFLRHPLTGMRLEPEALRRFTEALEIFICRKHRFPPALPWAERARSAFAREPRPTWPWGEIFDAENQRDLHGFCRQLDAFFLPFSQASEAHTLSDWAWQLATALDESRADHEPETPLSARIDLLLDDLARFGGDVHLTPRELQDVVEQGLAKITLPPASSESRAEILGFLEARLIHVDRVLLGGLNEGSVPPAVVGDPFLNRAMRLGLGLQPGERRIGQSAHDFSMLAGLRDLVLTRSERVGTSPGTPSRFLKRLEAFTGIETWRNAVIGPGLAVLEAIRRADSPGARASIKPPAIIPERPRLPATLSITDFETLRRDPYAIYARKILRLRPLDPLDPEPDARHRGTLLHKVLERFARERVEINSDIAGQRLRDIAAEEFRILAHEPEAFQFWWSAFESIADGFVAFDAKARAENARILVETRADLPFSLPNGESVRLTGKADRIEIDPDGLAAIIDYKSGAPPTWSQILSGLAPQLPLTAALVQRGGFAALQPIQGIGSIAYLPIGGGEPVIAAISGKGPAQLYEAVSTAWFEAETELRAFASGERAYRSRLKPMRRDDQGDFDHLARVGEWSLGASDDEEDEA